MGVNRLERDVMRIRPVVVQALPNSARPLSDIGPARPEVVHLEVGICAVLEQLGPAGSEIGQSRDELLGYRCSCLVKANGDHQAVLSRRFWSMPPSSASHSAMIPGDACGNHPQLMVVLAGTVLATVMSCTFVRSRESLEIAGVVGRASDDGIGVRHCLPRAVGRTRTALLFSGELPTRWSDECAVDFQG